MYMHIIVSNERGQFFDTCTCISKFILQLQLHNAHERRSEQKWECGPSNTVNSLAPTCKY